MEEWSERRMEQGATEEDGAAARRTGEHRVGWTGSGAEDGGARGGVDWGGRGEVDGGVGAEEGGLGGRTRRGDGLEDGAKGVGWVGALARNMGEGAKGRTGPQWQARGQDDWGSGLGRTRQGERKGIGRIWGSRV